MKTIDDVFSWYIMGLGGVLGALVQMSREECICPQHWYEQLKIMQEQMRYIVEKQASLIDA